LQLYKANPSFEVEEREKRGEEKNIYWSYVGLLIKIMLFLLPTQYKNLIAPGNLDHSTQLVTRDMTVVDSWTGFLKHDKKINTKYKMKIQLN